MERPLESGVGIGSSKETSSSVGTSKPSGSAGAGGIEQGGGYSAPSGRPILGPDGREASETWGDLSSGVTGLVEKNPMMAALTSLGIGLIVGMIVGAAVARD